MSQGKFEGDLSKLSSKQIKFISEVLNEKGFQDGTVTVTPVGEAGDNYASNVVRITATKEEISLKIIVKVASKVEYFRMAMNTRIIFLNEIVMYNEILPKYSELEKEAGIPKDERFKYATCYGCLLDVGEELILLEDLSVSEFIMLDRFTPLTDSEIKLVLKNFAKLHSLSYALKYKAPSEYNTLKNKLTDVWSLTETEMMEQMMAYFQMVINDAVSVIDPKYSHHIKALGSDFVEISNKLRDFDKESKFSVIQQGDSWTNNMLFKFEKDTAVSCCFIDYQISRVNSPVGDLHYMILNCTDHETRAKHFPDWIEYYHKQLEYNLQDFGLKANYVYPREQLDADLKRHGKLSLGMSIMLCSVISREADAAQKFKTAFESMNPDDMLNPDDMMENMTEFSINNLDDKTKNIIKARIEGAIETFLQFGLISGNN